MAACQEQKRTRENGDKSAKGLQHNRQISINIQEIQKTKLIIDWRDTVMKMEDLRMTPRLQRYNDKSGKSATLHL